MTNKVVKHTAAADLAAEQALAAAAAAKVEADKLAKDKHDKALDAACKFAAALGIKAAEGSNSLTALSLDYQREVALGNLRRGDNVALYNAYADSHDKRAAGMKDSGLKAFSKATRDAAVNNLLTFTDPFVIHQAMLDGDDKAPSEQRPLYARIIALRDKMEADELSPGSALSHYVRVNRAIGKRAEETAASIPPEKFELTDAHIVRMLAKDAAKVKTDSMLLQDVVDLLKKFEKRNPAVFAEIAAPMRSLRAVKVAIELAEVNAENEREAAAEREVIAAAEREAVETRRILEAAAAREAEKVAA